jgi:hypothetical protein
VHRIESRFEAQGFGLWAFERRDDQVAGLAALRVALGPAGLDRVWSITATGNTRSQAVMRRLGLLEHSRYRHPDLSEEDELSPQVAYCSPLRETANNAT